MLKPGPPQPQRQPDAIPANRWHQDPRLYYVVEAILTVCFAIVCVRSLTPIAPYAAEGDSAWFAAVARQPIDSLSFWVSSRPWGYPLLLKIVGYDLDRIAAAQLNIYILSHVFFAWAMFEVFGRRSLGLIASAAIYLYALSPYVSGWVALVMSESVSFSWTAIVLGTLALYLQDSQAPTRRYRSALWGGALVVSSVFLGSTRDNWPYLLVLIAIALAVAGIVPGSPFARTTARRRLHWGLVVVLLAAFVTQAASARTGNRWKVGLTNVILQRVLPDDEVREEWRTRYGMPVDPRILSLTGEYQHARGAAIERHAGFQEWLVSRGLRSYATHLVTHPVATFRGISTSQRRTINQFSFEYTDHGEGTVIARLVKQFVFFPLFGPPVWYMGLPIIVASWMAVRGPKSLRAVALTTLVLAVYLPFGAALTYLADSNEVIRHGLPVALGVRLVWILILILVGENARQSFISAANTSRDSLVDA
jgi:hypothetical protein